MLFIAALCAASLGLGLDWLMTPRLDAQGIHRAPWFRAALCAGRARVARPADSQRVVRRSSPRGCHRRCQACPWCWRTACAWRLCRGTSTCSAAPAATSRCRLAATARCWWTAAVQIARTPRSPRSGFWPRRRFAGSIDYRTSNDGRGVPVAAFFRVKNKQITEWLDTPVASAGRTPPAQPGRW